jgi:hypothetical protein
MSMTGRWTVQLQDGAHTITATIDDVQRQFDKHEILWVYFDGDLIYEYEATGITFPLIMEQTRELYRFERGEDLFVLQLIRGTYSEELQLLRNGRVVNQDPTPTWWDKLVDFVSGFVTSSVPPTPSQSSTKPIVFDLDKLIIIDQEESGADPEDYNIAVIRSLVRDAFTNRELWRLIQECSAFHPLLSRVPYDDNLENMIDILTEFCRKQRLFPELLSEVKKRNHKQYERYEQQLKL